MPLNRILKIMMSTLRLLFIFSFFIFISAFQTEQCNHQEITKSLKKLQDCMNADGGEDEDVCYEFSSANDCVRKHLSGCFDEEDVDRSANETLGQIRKASTKLILSPSYQRLIGFTVSETDLDSLFATCPNMPGKKFSENLKPTLIYAIDLLQTDRNCTKEQINGVNTDFAGCAEKQKKNVQAMFSRRTSSRSSLSSMQSTICSVMEDTLGKCLRKPLPDCFSKREEVFLKTTLSENLKSSTKGIEKQAKQKLSGLSFSGCPVFSEQIIFSHSTTIGQLSLFPQMAIAAAIMMKHF
eukprot:GFUD01040411.1.p1 GENE.GFUD01040411.1~~GFUD01040411.1.p1  ORF type:complete len:296 (-),score=48.91 GFUD01040411.1:111-998(-)